MKFKSKIFSRFELTQDFFRFLLVDRILIEKDNVVLVTGKRGDGKTSFALKSILGFYDMKRVEDLYNKEINRNSEEEKKVKLEGFTPFDFNLDLVFTRKELEERCRNNRRGFVLADEAVVNAARRNAMSQANKILHQIITINRKNLNTLFFCMPSIEDFDVSILQYVTHWIHIDDRGLAVVMLPSSKTIFGRKNWDVDRMKKIYDKFLEEKPGLTSVPYWLFDNFRGYIRFRKLTAGIERKYLQIAHDKKNKEIEENEKAKANKEIKKTFTDEQEGILSKIIRDLKSGKIHDNADYYSYASTLGFTKDKLNREVNKLLIESGEGRTSNRIIQENKKKEKEEFEKKAQATKIIY